MDKTPKACPSCRQPIARKEFRATVRKCISCGRVICKYCNLDNLCLDCYIATHSRNFYYEPLPVEGSQTCIPTI